MSALDSARQEDTALPLAVREHEYDLVVDDRYEAAEQVVVLTLRDARRRPLPEWAPGAHIDLVLPDGIIRQYSLCGDPADRLTWRIGVLRDCDGRGGSMVVYDRLHPGVPVRVRGPRNHFGLAPSPEYLFIAGGIGITPILPMITVAEVTGAQWRLVYGGRARHSMAFADELAVYGDRVTLWPQDVNGLIDLASLLDTPSENALVYCCGPEPLLEARRGEARRGEARRGAGRGLLERCV